MCTDTTPLLTPGPLDFLDNQQWCAIQTRSRHERVVTRFLENSGIETFLPLYSQSRSWSDRRKVVDFPLFPGYIFARAVWSTQARVKVFQTNGVVGFVGSRKDVTPIPDDQIDAVRELMQVRAECSPHPYLRVGQRVRICNGSLSGLEGILVRVANGRNLVVSIDSIHRSVSIGLAGYEIEPV
jgi:transcriptional antiterminator NusG